MKDVIVNLKTDAKTKKQAQKVAEELGFSLSAILNAFLKQVVRDRNVHFVLPNFKDKIYAGRDSEN